MQQAERDQGSRADGLRNDEREELVRLQRENRRLTMGIGSHFIPTSDSQILLALGSSLFSRCSATAEMKLESRSPKRLVGTGLARLGKPSSFSDYSDF